MDEKPEDTMPSFPLEKILNEMVDLLQYAVKNIDKLPQSKTRADVDAQLEKLQHDMSIFDATVGMTSLDATQLELLSEETQSLFKKCETLKSEMGKKLEALHAMEKEQAELGVTPQAGALESKGEALERKQKGLRRIVRSQKWKQM